MQISAMRRPAAMLPGLRAARVDQQSRRARRASTPIRSSAASATSRSTSARGARVHADRGRRVHDGLALRPCRAPCCESVRRRALLRAAAAAAAARPCTAARRPRSRCRRAGGRRSSPASQAVARAAMSRRHRRSRPRVAPAQDRAAARQARRRRPRHAARTAIRPRGSKMSSVAPGRGLISNSQKSFASTRKSALFKPTSGTAAASALHRVGRAPRHGWAEAAGRDRAAIAERRCGAGDAHCALKPSTRGASRHRPETAPIPACRRLRAGNRYSPSSAAAACCASLMWLPPAPPRALGEPAGGRLPAGRASDLGMGNAARRGTATRSQRDP